ncbi:MAG: GAK system CofD-like protein [Alphaproteobacteria bacterium]|nr:GAK system CofD-like protein [Alphaproteobacteria bacterium]
MTRTPRITRPIILPDRVRAGRYERAPDLGPRVLFFSGGTALNETSRVLKAFTHNSIHLITPFDSGGSSAVLRRAFAMPAVGDLRSRLMALADETLGGHPEIVSLFALRLSRTARRPALLKELKSIADGEDARIRAVYPPMRRIIRGHLRTVLKAMPDGMDLRGASIGNLILAGGYLGKGRRLNPVVAQFSKLAGVLGAVRPIVDTELHLAARLKTGRVVVGQHRITGKEARPLKSPVTDLFLTAGPDDPAPVPAPRLSAPVRALILGADLICYPPGSFYTSLCANFLPRGVGKAVAAAPCPKVYVPGLGRDPERIGLDLGQSVFRLVEMLRRDAGADRPTADLLDFVLIDGRNGESLAPDARARLEADGVTVLDAALVTPQSAPYYDPQRLVTALLSLT